jgi:ABC-2 type transport system ATP-binding protein
MENAIKVTGLTKRYSGFELSDVSFKLPRGTVMGFIGRNGAGKTTTIKLIMGLIHPDAGSVEILGTMVNGDDPEYRERIGFVYDEHGFYDWMTVKGIGKITAPFYKTWNQAEFDRLVREFGLNPKEKKGGLSRGQRTKLSIAIALSHNAEILKMD